MGENDGEAPAALALVTNFIGVHTVLGADRAA